MQDRLIKILAGEIRRLVHETALRDCDIEETAMRIKKHPLFEFSEENRSKKIKSLAWHIYDFARRYGGDPPETPIAEAEAIYNALWQTNRTVAENQPFPEEEVKKVLKDWAAD